MITVNTPEVPGKAIRESLGIVSGSVVQSKHVGRDIMAQLKTLIGGEVRGYTEMLEEARDTALGRMLAKAEALGADAVVNVKFESSAVMQGMSEILAYGTAVKLSR